MSDSVVQMHLELQELEAHCPGSLFHVYCPLGQSLFLTPTCLSPDTAPCHSLEDGTTFSTAVARLRQADVGTSTFPARPADLMTWRVLADPSVAGRMGRA